MGHCTSKSIENPNFNTVNSRYYPVTKIRKESFKNVTYIIYKIIIPVHKYKYEMLVFTATRK